MMKEIKFRAWNRVLKKMLPVEGLHFGYCGIKGIKGEEIGVLIGEPYVNEDFPKNPVWQTERYFRNKPHPNSTVILMQYSGLKDKKGREIYEGDILNTNTSTDVVIPYYVKEILPFIKLVDVGGREYNNGDYYLGNSVQSHQWGEFVIIGNIFENPELLKEIE